MKGVLKPPEISFQKPFVVNFGSNIWVQTISEPNAQIDLRNFISYGGYEYPVQIRFEERKLLVSAEIENEEGETVAKITDNHWGVKEDVLIARDRNYNDYAFEVMDSDLIPVLQVAVQGQNTIYMGGVFFFPVGRMLVTPNGLIVNPSSEQINEYAKPIFRYPSDDHLGEMAMPEFIMAPIGISRAQLVIGLGGIFVASGALLVAYGMKNYSRLGCPKMAIMCEAT